MAATHEDDDAKTFTSTRTGSVLRFAASRPVSASRRGSHASEEGADAQSAGSEAQSVAEAAARRVLTLQVEWCTVSIARAGTYALPLGACVKRRQADIAHLDVFRTLWTDEAGRWAVLEELKASYDSM